MKSLLILVMAAFGACLVLPVRAGEGLVEAEPQGLLWRGDSVQLRLRYVTPSIVHVQVTREGEFSPSNTGVLVDRAWPPVPAEVQEGAGHVALTGGTLRVFVDNASGALSFYGPEGELFHEPVDQPRSLEPVEIPEVRFDMEHAKKLETVDGGRQQVEVIETGVVDKAWKARQYFDWAEGEALYGLGSHEEAVLNLRGTRQYLYQHNMKMTVPVLVSSRGYGLLFDEACPMIFHDDAEGSYLAFGAVRDLDYYVIYGPELDTIVAGYRELTGAVPMLPRWAFGYIQSKERYNHMYELLGVVAQYRKRGLPLDGIVQDWLYWPTGWGIKAFDPARYPDPAEMMMHVHNMHAHLMISIWPSLSGEHPEVAHMQDKGYMLKGRNIYDAYSDEARAEYWRYADDNIFSQGIDAWWSDCTEPTEADWSGATKPTAEERYALNTEALCNLLGWDRALTYSLMHAKGLYENQRETTEAKRVVNLTRSAYAGQQRYGTISWSGDVSARWEVLAQQIPAGLNFTATGLPYWTNDIGAFFVKPREDLWFIDGTFPEGNLDLGYREFYTRWFQYATFLPIFRSHGTDTAREVWHFGEPGEPFYDTLETFLKLRYRLLPYIYSLAGLTTQAHYTMLRALAFDFREDPEALDQKTEYMFGPAFLVCPVTQPMLYGPGSEPLEGVSQTREVYLPKGTSWYDYWTNKSYSGGQSIVADAPLATMPLFVRAGAIVPFGPDVKYSDQQLDAPWTICIYPGANGSFTVYEDSGDGYDYEQGAFATWQMSWDDATGTLSIGERQGSYPGMTSERRLRIVVIREGMTWEAQSESAPSVVYTGEPLTWKDE